MSRGRTWTANDERRLKTLWCKGVALELVASELRRTPIAISQRVSQLHLKRAIPPRYSVFSEDSQHDARTAIARQIAGHHEDVATGRAKPFKSGDLKW